MRYAVKVMISTYIQSGAKLVDYKGTVLKYPRRKDAELLMARIAEQKLPHAELTQQLEVVDLNDTSKIGWLSPAMRLY